MATKPDLDEIREWIGVAVGSLSDGQLTRMIEAETEDQAALCRIPAGDSFPADLAAALLRRVARAAAVKGIPLGVAPGGGDGIQGTPTIAELDSEILRYERRHRRLVIG